MESRHNELEIKKKQDSQHFRLQLDEAQQIHEEYEKQVRELQDEIDAQKELEREMEAEMEILN